MSNDNCLFNKEKIEERLKQLEELEEAFNAGKQGYASFKIYCEQKSIEAFKQFKQEQLSKRDWEILKMVDNNGWIHGYDEADKVCIHDCKIHSVRRLSDGEVFSVSDDEGRFGYGKIESFFIHSDKWMMAKCGDAKIILSDLKKSKKKEWDIYGYDVDGNIACVKIVFNNEVFSVGDEIEWGSCSLEKEMVHRKEKIDGFEVIDGGVYAITACKHKVHYSILQKAKKKVLLFVTEDWKEIYEGDKWWSVFLDSSDEYKLGMWDIAESDSSKGHEPNYDRNIKRFSTKEKAEEYILRNKPLLSLQDLLNVWDIDDRFQKEDKEWYAQSPMFKTFQQLAKSKMDGK